MMKVSDPTKELRELILEKEKACALEGKFLKEHFKLTYESLKPLTIVKNTLKSILTSPEVKTNLVNSAMGSVTGFLAKKMVIGNAHHPFLKIIGTILEIVVANKVTKNGDAIKSAGNIIINKILNTQKS